MLYAAYGSNLHPGRLAARTPSARLVGTAAVGGWRLRFNKRGRDGSGKCNIVAAAGEVRVAVYELSPGDKRVLDHIEGVNFGYRDAPLPVPGFTACFAYFATDGHVDDEVMPYAWYKGLVLAGCAYHRFPDDYVEAIHAVKDRNDHDVNRHQANSELCQALQAGRGLYEWRGHSSPQV